MRKIGFVGLGNMGAPMATNLVKAGYEVHGYDLAPENVDAATRAGIVPAASVAAVVEKAEAVVTMLPAGAHVLNVWRNFLPHAEPGTLLIDCSTIDVASARQAHDLARARGCLSVDAPVSGGTGGAIAGTLTFMCGGDEDAVGRARPMLEAMGRKVVHCGTGGNGQAAKICNNMILGISMIAVSEAFVLGEKLGLSHQALFDVASTSSGQCWSLTTYCPVPGPVPTSPANHEYKAGFAAALMLKDLRLARDAADSTGTATQLGAEAARLYTAFAETGRGGADFSGIVEFVRSRSKSSGPVSERRSPQDGKPAAAVADADTTKAAEIILETSGLTKEFGGLRAVNDVNLQVKTGTIHALIGPNGAGKTTCFNLITKFLPPTAGTIRFKGKDITQLQPAEVARLGLVRSFQISATFPHMTVLENVLVSLQRPLGTAFHFWRSERSLDVLHDRARALLDDVGLADFAEIDAVELPYGHKRALEIATTLALDPEMLLLDEPMAGMGHEDISRISALIRRVAKSRTVLMVEHNLSVVADLSDTITVLARGEILAEGSYSEVSGDPRVIEAYMGSGTPPRGGVEAAHA